MNSQQTQQVIDALKSLADKLGSTAEAIWHVYIRQARIEGITDSILYVAVAIASVIWWKLLRHAKENDWFDGEFDFEAGIGFTITGILIGILIVCSFFSFNSTVTEFMNPQYWALQQLFTQVKK